jgi:hypothetical protein
MVPENSRQDKGRCPAGWQCHFEDGDLSAPEFKRKRKSSGSVTGVTPVHRQGGFKITGK